MRYVNAVDIEKVCYSTGLYNNSDLFLKQVNVFLWDYFQTHPREHTLSLCLHWFVIMRLDVLNLNFFFYFINMTETTFVVPFFIYLDVIWIMKQQHLFFQKCFYLYRNEEEWEGEKAKRGSNNAKQIWKKHKLRNITFHVY